MYTKQAVTLTMFDLAEDLQVVGVVERVDAGLRRLKIDGEWFDMDDVLKVEMSDSEFVE